MNKYMIVGDGGSPHILKWTKELSRYFEVYLVSSQDIDPKIREVIPEDRLFPFNLTITESGGNFQYFSMIAPLIRIIKRVIPDFVNAHYITSHGFVAAIAKVFSGHQFKLIQSAWGTDILVTPFINGLYRMVTRFSLKHANLATADSEDVAGIIHDLSSLETMTFPFGLDKLPDALPQDKDPNFFFSNRTLNANSNIDRILHLFARILEKNEDARMVVANDGSLKDDLTELSRQLDISDAVEFVGFISQDEQNEYYRKAQFYISILSSDALSVSLLEAMAFGCIPVVSDLPASTAWVTDGRNGIVMSEGTNPDTLSGIQGNVQTIFEMNRQLIAEKAIFPKSIELFHQKLRSI